MGSIGTDEDPMHVVVVGAGFCGLACAIACRQYGMKVTVLEQVGQLLPLGDTIGFGSNVTKLFQRWGIFDQLHALACLADECVVHNWDGARELARDDAQGRAEQDFGHPVVIGQRGSLHAVFFEEAKKRGVTIRLGCKVAGYDQDKPSVLLEGGEEIIGDVIVASDGVKSKGREQVLGYVDKPISSGYAIFRAYMDADVFRGDPIAGHFLEGDQSHLWIGPDKHGYVVTMRGGTKISATLTHKDLADVDEGWSFPGKREDVLSNIQGWDSAFVRVWEKIENIIDFKLVYRDCLEKWVTDSGRIIIAGDAAHPFLPTSTQGASQAIEDAATIALCLAKAGKSKVPVALNTAFRLRLEHVKAAQQMGIKQRDEWHNLHSKESGEQTEELDMSKGLLKGYQLWTHDCEKVVHDDFDTVSAQVERDLQSASTKL